MSDGEQIRIITGGDGTRDRTARYIDAGHMELSHESGAAPFILSGSLRSGWSKQAAW